MKLSSSNSTYDFAGVCTSVLCIIHCISIPIMLVLGLESIVAIVEVEWVEWTIIGCSLFLGLIAFYTGFIKHKQHFVPVLFVAGFLLIVNGENVAQEWLGLILSVIGAALISYAHIQNIKWSNYATTNH